MAKIVVTVEMEIPTAYVNKALGGSDVQPEDYDRIFHVFATRIKQADDMGHNVTCGEVELATGIKNYVFKTEDGTIIFSE